MRFYKFLGKVRTFTAFILGSVLLAACAPGAGLSAVTDAISGKLPVEIKSAGSCFIPENAANTLNCPVYVKNSTDEVLNVSHLMISIGFDRAAPLVSFRNSKLLPNSTHTFVATFANTGGRFQPRTNINLYVSASEFGVFDDASASIPSSGGRGAGRTGRANDVLPIAIGNIPQNTFKLEESAFYRIRTGLKSLGYRCEVQNQNIVCLSRITNDTATDIVLDMRYTEGYAVDAYGLLKSPNVSINKLGQRASIVVKAGATFDVETFLGATPIQSAVVTIEGLGSFLYNGVGY